MTGGGRRRSRRGRGGSHRGARKASPPVRRAWGAEAWAGALAAALAAGFWLASVGARGFHFSPDSMSYAALARGFADGHPFSGTILWRYAQPDRFQAIWPPLYPALIAAVHWLGASLPRAELLISGVAYAVAVTFAVLAVRRACGTCPWLALPVLAGFPTALYVAGYGWTEPVCLALLGLHYWLAAWAMRTVADGRPLPLGLAFGQAFAVGLAFLDRYAAAPFLASALLLPAALAVLSGGRHRSRAVAGTAAAGVGAGICILPWTVAAFVLDGHVGDPYLKLPTSWRPLIRAVHGTVVQAVSQTLTVTPTHFAAIMAAQRHLLAVTAVLLALAIVVALALRTPRRAPAGGWQPPALLAAMLAVDTVVYTGALVWLRHRFFFDSIGPRLMAPGLYPALLLAAVLVAAIPWSLPREALAVPVGLVVLGHGWHSGAAAVQRPQIAASVAGPWCSAGTDGDCSLFSWLSSHTTDADLVIGNAPFTIDFALGRTTREVAPYPYNPKPAGADFRNWAAGWWAIHPSGGVFVALDTQTGPIAIPSDPYGPVMAALWSLPSVSLGDGVVATRVAQGQAWRVLRVGPGQACGLACVQFAG